MENRKLLRKSSRIFSPPVHYRIKDFTVWKSVFFFSTFSVMATTFADSWSDMAKPLDMDLWVMKWRSAWPIFHGPVIMPYILKTIWCMYIIPRDQYDLTFDLKINAGHCDLNSTLQWFCLILWRLFDVHVWTLLFGIMSQYDPTFDLKINVSHGPVILPYILKTIWCMNISIWDYESVWAKIWPQNKYRSLWPIFHGTVILRYIWKTIWYENIILWDYRSVWPDVWLQNKCTTVWPIFHGSVILSYFSKTNWCMSVIFSDNETVWVTQTLTSK